MRNNTEKQLLDPKEINPFPDHSPARSRRLKMRIIFLSVLMFLTSFFHFIFDLENPKEYKFDEQRYTKAGIALHENQTNENWSHPAFGKKLIGISISFFGDNSNGWRMMSALCGALIIVILALITFVLMRSIFLMILTSVILNFSLALYSQSRLANLDIFMILFIFIALFFSAICLQKFKTQYRFRLPLLICIGASFGLAIGSKWAAIPVALLWIILLIISNKTQRISAALILFFSLTLFYAISQLSLVGLWHPKYAPDLHQTNLIQIQESPGAKYEPIDLLPLQVTMLIGQLGFSNEAHPFQSKWYEWPFLQKPVVYFHSTKPINLPAHSRVILFLYSHAILLFGFLSLVFCIYRFWRTQDQAALFIIMVFCSLWLTWVFIPRKTSFSYYFLPAYLSYSIGISYFFHAIRNLKYKNKSVFMPIFLIVMALIISEHFFQLDLVKGIVLSDEEFIKYMQ